MEWAWLAMLAINTLNGVIWKPPFDVRLLWG